MFVAILLASGVSNASGAWHKRKEWVDVKASCSEEFISKCNEVKQTKQRRTVNIDTVLSILPHIKLQEGYTMDCATSGRIWDNDCSIVYVRPLDREPLDPEMCHSLYFRESLYDLPDIYRPLEKIVMPEKLTEAFLWEAWLVNRMWRDLPVKGTFYREKDVLALTKAQFLDGIRNDRFAPYLFTCLCEEEVGPDGKVTYREVPDTEAQIRIESFIALCECEPRVYIYSLEPYRIVCWHWNSWRGIEVDTIDCYVRDGVIEFEQYPSAVVLSYDCYVL